MEIKNLSMPYRLVGIAIETFIKTHCNIEMYDEYLHTLVTC